MDINLNLLKYFYEVVNEENITKAASKCHITQPAMTRAIKELETQLNTKLLNRSQKGAFPTIEGTILYNHIETILKEVNITKSIIENNEMFNDLYIGMTTSNYFNLIIEALREFKEKNKNVRVHVLFENINTLNDLKKTGKLDIIIKNKSEIIADFKKIEELELENFFVASKKHFPELDNKHIELKDLLNNYPLVILNESSPGRRHLDNWLKEKGIILKPEYEFNSFDFCKKIVKQGLAIGINNSVETPEKDIIFIETDKIEKRYFELGYNLSSKNKYIEKFIDIYMKTQKKDFK